MANFDQQFKNLDPYQKQAAFTMFVFELLLVFAFIILKLCGVIAWSWWWVFAPVWIPMVIGLIVLLFFGH